MSDATWIDDKMVGKVHGLAATCLCFETGYRHALYIHAHGTEQRDDAEASQNACRGCDSQLSDSHGVFWKAAAESCTHICSRLRKKDVRGEVESEGERGSEQRERDVRQQAGGDVGRKGRQRLELVLHSEQ